MWHFHTDVGHISFLGKFELLVSFLQALSFCFIERIKATGQEMPYSYFSDLEIII